MSNPEEAANLSKTGTSRNGHSHHKAYLLSNGTHQRLSTLEEIVYRIHRMNFRDELSFNTFKPGDGTAGLSELQFTIGAASTWVFADPPFEFSRNDNIECKLDPNDKKKAIIRVLGDSNPDAEIKYTLRYLAGGAPKFHDPRIRNGQGVPIIPGVPDPTEEELRAFVDKSTDEDRKFMIRELIGLMKESL
jgi:hypothetical protein